MKENAIRYRKLSFVNFPGKLAEEADAEKRQYPDKYCFVLGAGASKSSGIKTGEQLVELWEKELCEENPTEHQRWKDSLGITGENRSSFYGAYFSKMFQDPWKGHLYLEEEMHDKHPGAGYVMLSAILCHTRHNIVITTNFDRMTEDAIGRYQNRLPMVIGHEYLLPYFRPQIERPYILKIHRDLLLAPKNTKPETEKLSEEWKECLDRVFRSYHPIFIGYAGNDKSLMNFLNDNAEKFRGGDWRSPYWTLYGKTALSPDAERFMNAAGGYVVQDCDFDVFLLLLGKALKAPPWPTLDRQKEALETDYRRINEKMNEAFALGTQSPERAEPERGAAEGRSPRADQPDPDRVRQVEELSQAVERFSGDKDPRSRDARYRQAVLAHNRGDYGEAEGLLRQLTAEEPENAKYHDQLSTALHEMKRYEEARAEHQRAVELEPGNAYYHNQLGVTLYEMKRYAEARAEHQRAVELEPENALYHNQLGVTLHLMKRYAEALAEHQRAVELEPENARYHDNLGVTLYEMKRYAEARAEYQRAVELEPENARYHDNLGGTLHWMKRYEEARAEKQRAVELEPENALYHNQLGVTLNEMKCYAEARAEHQRAVELEPGNARYHNQLGVTLHEMKRYEEARKEEQLAVDMEPENAFYRYELGNTLRKMKRYQAALAETEQAIALEPDNPKYYRSLEWLYMDWGKFAEARKARKKAEALLETGGN